jgi:hypothetical protein
MPSLGHQGPICFLLFLLKCSPVSLVMKFKIITSDEWKDMFMLFSCIVSVPYFARKSACSFPPMVSIIVQSPCVCHAGTDVTILKKINEQFLLY